jgi:3-dehydroquinate dehydratase-2
MRILIINGPNLNLLGKRQPEIYGYESFDEYLIKIKTDFPEASLDYFQSNHEGELIDRIQQAEGLYEGIILNPGGYSHTSVSLADAVAAINVPVIEVHISNIYAREEFRRHSYISPYCRAVISGLGLEGYRAAVRFFSANR